MVLRSKSSTLRHWSKTKAPAHVSRAPGRMHSLSGWFCIKESGVKVEHLGLLHSHPNDRTEDNDNFSWGDGLVSAISGRIYLSTPGGELYAPDRKDAWKVIPTGFAHDALVSQNKSAGEIKKTGNEHPGLRIAYLPFFKGAE